MPYHRLISTVELVADDAATPGPASRHGVDPDDATAPRRVRRPAPHVIGLVGIVVSFIAIGSLFAFEQPPFLEADEIAHLAYAHEIASFHLPVIDERVFPEVSATEWRAEWAARRDDRYRGAWVANHPPLNYMIAAPSIWFSNWTNRADGGLLFLRLQNILLASVGVALTYFVAMEMTRGSRRLGLLAAGAVALVPQGHTLFSHGLNDGLAFAAGTGVVWAALRCLRAPHSPRNMWLLSGFTVVAAGARAATLLLAIALVALLAVCRLVARRRSIAERVGDAVRISVVGLGPAAVLFGWFYVRNQVRYGDIGGSTFLFHYFRRGARGSIVDMLQSGHTWGRMYRRMTSTAPLNWSVPRFATLIAVLAVAGLVLALVIRKRHVWRAGVAVGLLSVAVITLTVAQHLSGGGNAYPRYFFPVLGVMACLMMIGLDRIVPRVLPLVVLLAMACWLMTKIPMSVDPLSVTRPRDAHRPTPAALQVLPAGDWARRLVAALLVAGGVAALYGLIAESIRGLRRPHAFGSNQSPIETPGSRHTSSAPSDTIVGSSSGANT